MKKIIFLFLVLIPFIAITQSKVTTARGITSGTTYSNWKFSPQTDTLQAVEVKDYTRTNLQLLVKDSCSVAVSYRPSYDGVTFYESVLIDSLSNATNGGNTKGFTLPAAASAFEKVQFIFTVGSFREGFTNDTLKMKIVQTK